MKIASQQTFQQFDKLKEQMFAHKKKSRSQSNTIKQIPKPIINKRIIFPLALLSGGIYLIYRNSPSLYQFLFESHNSFLLNSHLITYHEKLSIESSICFIKNIWLKQRHKGMYNLLNKIYVSKLQADYTYLTNKGKQTKLSISTRSRYAFWIFSIFNDEKVKLINQYGDLIQKRRRSKLMILDLLRLWQKQEYRLLKRQKLFETYESQKNIDSRNLCQKLHFISTFQVQKQQKDHLIKECIEQSSKVHLKIKKFINTRLQKQKYTK